jgi:hypothetical protein
MESGGKRTVQVNVKMSGKDFELLKQAAEMLWPGAVISNSGVILGLAKLGANEVVSRKKISKRLK